MNAISVHNLAKSYTLAHQHHGHVTLAESLLHRFRHPFAKPETETFWALKDLSFDIHPGDVVGVIGRNGAGKSTLLKILSRITEPTEGEVQLRGRVGSLLEVGTGFHPELTGRENIYLNGNILGMRKKEIDRQFDAIVDFSGCERFLDTPVKRYSSGMYVRLAFAVAAHLESEILIVDEVLAVGDAEFQRKCLGKMRDVATGGRTVLFVSHHMQSVQVLCNSALYLDKGRCTYAGPVSGAIEKYVGSFGKAGGTSEDISRRPGTGELRFTNVSPTKDFFSCGEEKKINFTIRRTRPCEGPFHLSCHIHSEQGVEILHCDSRVTGNTFNATDELSGEFVFRTPWLKPGNYRVDLYICSFGHLDRFENACNLHIIPLLPYPAAAHEECTSGGVVFADFAFRTQSDIQAGPRNDEARMTNDETKPKFQFSNN